MTVYTEKSLEKYKLSHLPYLLMGNRRGWGFLLLT